MDDRGRPEQPDHVPHDRGDRDNVPGVGLGLSVAKGFTDAVDGTITAEDTPGGGLTIVLSFPVAAATPA